MKENRNLKIFTATKTVLLILVLVNTSGILNTNATKSNSEQVQLKWSHKFANATGDIAMSSDGKYLAVGGYPGKIYFFETSEASEPLWSSGVRSIGYVESLSISSDGSYVAVGNVGALKQPSTVNLFDRNGTWLWRIHVYSNHVYTAISPDGKYVAALGGGVGGGTLYLYRNLPPPSGQPLRWEFDTSAYGSVDYHRGVLFSRDNEEIYVGTTQGVLVLDTTQGPSEPTRFLLSERADRFAVSGDGTDIACVQTRFHEDKKYGEVQLYKDSILSWNFQTEGSIDMTGVDISADGRNIVAGGMDYWEHNGPGKVYLFRDGTLVLNYSIGGVPDLGNVVPVSISSDGRFLAAAGEDGVVYFFEQMFDARIPQWVWWGVGIVPVAVSVIAILWLHNRSKRLKQTEPSVEEFPNQKRLHSKLTE